VGGAHDKCAGVIATDSQGLRWVIKCRHRNGLTGAAVDTADLYVLNGTSQQLHDVVILVANGRFRNRKSVAPTPGAPLGRRNLSARWTGPAYSHCGSCCINCPQPTNPSP
jgi:hypothetical protein